MSKKIYLDNSATTKLSNEVIDYMSSIMKEYYGNPSSLHTFGEKSKELLESSREIIGEVIGSNKKSIIFTSGGTESDNLAITGFMTRFPIKSHLITSEIEHPAVINTCENLKKLGYELSYVKTTNKGLIDLDDLKSKIKDNTKLISIMYCNNEIGTIQNIKKIGQIAKENNVIFHSDCVQALGKIKINVNDLNVDMMSFSSHKLHGPKGVGALYLKKGIRINPLNIGGHQERKLRGGTENLISIAGFAKAAYLANLDMDKNNKKIKELRDYFENKVLSLIPHIRINCDINNRLPNISNITFKYIEGEAILLHLDIVGVAVSTGSACSSLSLEPSHVLIALGLKPENAHGSIRFSFSKYNTKEEIDYLLKELPGIISTLRNLSPLYPGEKNV